MANQKIYEFSNYRLFLSDYAEHKKKLNPNWSKALWAKKLGLKGTASLTMVLNGERKPGKKITNALVEYFKFNTNEKKFFINLVELEKKSEDSFTKTLILNELEKLYPYKNFELFNSEQFNVMSSWESVILRRFAFFKNFEMDLDRIYKGLIFKISKFQLKKQFELLKAVGLVSINKGRISASNSDFKTLNDIPTEAIKKFHEAVIQKSFESVRLISSDKRDLQSLTLEFDNLKINDAKEEIRSFISYFNNKFKTSNPNSIYQLNLQFIPYFEENKIKGENNVKG